MLNYFIEKIAILKTFGLHDIIIDPGFGFGKTSDHNYLLLKSLPQFQIFNCPILVGLSRKSMITKILNITPVDSLNGTTVLNTLAILNGADILRVHDVAEAVEVKKIIKAYKLNNL